jgi:Ca2+-binding EF-hand superfamily protein/RNAse (barnase) inhibitor barstar
LNTYHMQPYLPPEGLYPKDLEALWKDLIKNENIRKKLIAEKIQASREALRQEFAEAANALHRVLEQLEQLLSNVGGELEVQLKGVENIAKSTDVLVPRLKTLEDIHLRCEEANVDENEFTSYTYDDLHYELGLLQSMLQKKCQFIENQMVVKKQTNVTPQQLEEFEITFHHFDRDHDNMLGREEFENCLAGLGRAYEDAEIDRLFRRLAIQDKVNFEKFLEFLVSSITVDRATPAQISESFRALANGKPFITDEDLRIAHLRVDEMEYLQKTMPRTSDHQGYDFEAYLRTVFV